MIRYAHRPKSKPNLVLNITNRVRKLIPNWDQKLFLIARRLCQTEGSASTYDWFHCCAILNTLITTPQVHSTSLIFFFFFCKVMSYLLPNQTLSHILLNFLIIMNLLFFLTAILVHFYPIIIRSKCFSEDKIYWF